MIFRYQGIPKLAQGMVQQNVTDAGVTAFFETPASLRYEKGGRKREGLLPAVDLKLDFPYNIVN